jgi:hypothetical protein
MLAPGSKPGWCKLATKNGRLLRFWREPVHSRRTRLTLKENNIPVDATGKPDLSGYVDTAAYYAAMHDQALKAARVAGYDARLEFARRVHGTWGLIARGAESVPYALAMLASKESDAREDGAAVLSRGRQRQRCRRAPTQRAGVRGRFRSARQHYSSRREDEEPCCYSRACRPHSRRKHRRRHAMDGGGEPRPHTFGSAFWLSHSPSLRLWSG